MAVRPELTTGRTDPALGDHADLEVACTDKLDIFRYVQGPSGHLGVACTTAPLARTGVGDVGATGWSKGARGKALPVRRAQYAGAEDRGQRQLLVVADQRQVLRAHSRVLARKRIRAKAWRLGPALERARQIARRHGFCEPTGHRWRVLDQLAAGMDMPLVCVKPLLVGRARESEDYTRDKTDDKDAVLIARLVSDLRCSVPKRVEEAWARLRHLSARRKRLIAEATTDIQQLRDLLECVWPAVLAGGQTVRVQQLVRRVGRGARPHTRLGPATGESGSTSAVSTCSAMPVLPCSRSGWPGHARLGIRSP
ncbi:IS110 family transposase [Amycolatopsis anabasis]|uniref:IS110 family transposase n=1 Tax=Amycolatopsis anabasis TaxID=1840409 RepID=UPI001C554CD9|nr:transposase [Amycolatopsis anabasis]